MEGTQVRESGKAPLLALRVLCLGKGGIKVLFCLKKK